MGGTRLRGVCRDSRMLEPGAEAAAASYGTFSQAGKGSVRRSALLALGVVCVATVATVAVIMTLATDQPVFQSLDFGMQGNREAIFAASAQTVGAARPLMQVDTPQAPQSLMQQQPRPQQQVQYAQPQPQPQQMMMAQQPQVPQINMVDAAQPQQPRPAYVNAVYTNEASPTALLQRQQMIQQQHQQQQAQRAQKAPPKRKEDFSHKTELAFIDSGINSHYSKKKPVKQQPVQQRMVVVQQQPVQPVADEYDPSSQDQEDVLATEGKIHRAFMPQRYEAYASELSDFSAAHPGQPQPQLAQLAEQYQQHDSPQAPAAAQVQMNAPPGGGVFDDDSRSDKYSHTLN